MNTETIAAANGPTKFETLLGGAELSIATADGKLQTVKVRQIPLREYRALMEAQGDEFRWIELICEQPAGWAESLNPGDYNRLVEEAERVNADFFVWSQRQVARIRRLAPGLMERALETTAAAVKSPTISPTTRRTSPLLPG